MLAPPGLAGVLVADTTIGDVRGDEGFFHYRQYDAIALARTRTFEDVWCLLLDGTLPDATRRRDFADEVRSARELSPALLDSLPDIVAAAEAPMVAVRTAVSLLGGAERFEPVVDLDGAARRRDCVRVTAALPTIVAAVHRLGRGLEPVPPRRELDHAQNLLWMLTGEDPEPARARALEQYLVTTVDHGFNTSTFAARVIASAGADVAAAVVGGIGALSGPRHGGAPSRVLDLLDAVESAGDAARHLAAVVRAGERIPGFGHRVYRTDDPRAVFLREVAEESAAPRIRLAKEVERVAAAALADRRLVVNVEFYAAVVLDHCGIPRELFPPVFATSRVVGWCANLLEQAEDRRIIRPGARYVGPPPPQPVPEV